MYLACDEPGGALVYALAAIASAVLIVGYPLLFYVLARRSSEHVERLGGAKIASEREDGVDSADSSAHRKGAKLLMQVSE